MPILTQDAKYSVLQADLPGRGLVAIGILLQDPERNVLHARMRRDMETLTEEEDLWVFSALADDLNRKAGEMGAESLFRYLEETLSGAIRVTDREPVMVDDFERTVDRLYHQHVQSNVLQFRTHLPRYSLRVAAGKFLENEEVSEQGWVEAPEDLRITPDMFIAQIAGHSMEPLIPDGSLCVFRAGVAGARSGRLVLATDRENNAFSVKRYLSEKIQDGDTWRHARIRLESLNPGFPSWDLDPDEDKYRIIAEFIRVLC